MAKKKKPKMYRQGDVLLVQVESVDNFANKLDHTTVALGEATGHHHTFERGVELWESKVLDMVWVVADEPAPLTHQEHDTIIVDPGIYEVRHQREYNPKKVRRVID